MNVCCILSFFILNKLSSSFVYKTIVIMWLIFRLKMPCFSHQGFLGGGGGGGGGGHGILPTVLGYAMRGAREKHTK